MKETSTMFRETTKQKQEQELGQEQEQEQNNKTTLILWEVCESFKLGKPVDWEQIKHGNVNHTYRVDVRKQKGIRSYILQMLNSNAFKTPQKNVENHAVITKHLEEKLRTDPEVGRKTVRLYTTEYGSYLYVDSEGHYWRAMSFVYGALTVNKPDFVIMQKTGEAFGTFQSLLSDCPANLLHETIPGFHDTEKRMKSLISAARKDEYDRLREVKDLFDFLCSQSQRALFFKDALAKGDIPLRVTHNDTKCNNVMFDEKTYAPLAIIDLDTVMPGFAAHDFGDAIRYGANFSGEDEEDMSKIGLDLEMFRSFAEGYIPKVKENFDPHELKTLPHGVTAMTLELSSRFLTDYLEGDKYFITRKDKHNMLRAKCQAELLKDEIAKFNEMTAIIDKII